MGTLNMLGLAKRTKARFLISSTSGAPYPLSRNANLIAIFQRSTVTQKSTPNTKTSKSSPPTLFAH